MKIKKIGWTSFLLTSDNITALTDPLMLANSGVNFPKTRADVCIFTDSKDPKKSILEDIKLYNKAVGD